MLRLGFHLGPGYQGQGTAEGQASVPVITSSDSGSVDENATLSKSLTADQAVTWSIVAGGDGAQFEVSGSTLRWSSDGTRDFENPADANTDNVYIVTVRATAVEGGLTADQTISITVGDVAEAPAQFGTGDWSVTDAETGGDITITISVLPDDGGSALTDLEYQLDGGAWVSLGAAVTDDYPVSGLTDDVEVAVAIRAVNAAGAGPASATKAVTPTTAYPPVTVTTVYLETMHSGAPAARVTNAYLETIHSGAPAARVTTAYVEVLRSEADAA